MSCPFPPSPTVAFFVRFFLEGFPKQPEAGGKRLGSGWWFGMYTLCVTVSASASHHHQIQINFPLPVPKLGLGNEGVQNKEVSRDSTIFASPLPLGQEEESPEDEDDTNERVWSVLKGTGHLKMNPFFYWTL